MSLLRGAPLLLVAIAAACSTRALDPGRDGAVLAGSGGAGGRGGGPGGRSMDGGPDLIPVDPTGTGGSGLAVCGNGRMDPGEQCDDGNTNPGDGCSALCQIPCDWSCRGCGTLDGCPPLPRCGNGILDPGEACDDASLTVTSDGCASDCSAVEPGWRCQVPFRPCVPICGDKIVAGRESCDDGNTVAGDGCSEICLVEPSAARCGNGVVEGAEACDDGAANSATDNYGGCTTDCRYGGYCGDALINGSEDCDLGSGNNTAPYGQMSGCGPGCRYPHFCGDAILDDAEGERCDFGLHNGEAMSLCNSTCNIKLP